MFRIQAIQSLEQPELEPYRNMRRPLDHQRRQIFVAEGEKVVRRLLESTFPVVSVLLPEKWLPAFEPLLNARTEDIAVFIADRQLLEELTGFSHYQGVLAIGKIPARTSLDRILETSGRPVLLAAVEGITNAQNLGVLVRNGAAFGIHALLIGETSSSPYLRRAVRSSMGAIFQMPIIESMALVQTLNYLRARSIRCIAAHPSGDQRMASQTRFATDCCIVFGSEGYGLSPEILAACDEALAIPMHSNVDSLNVGSASAVFFYEATRQRGPLS
jgi:tRNA G18 (ribose-2'-O)-methylase SpoU